MDQDFELGHNIVYDDAYLLCMWLVEEMEAFLHLKKFQTLNERTLQYKNY